MELQFSDFVTLKFPGCYELWPLNDGALLSLVALFKLILPLILDICVILTQCPGGLNVYSSVFNI